MEGDGAVVLEAKVLEDIKKLVERNNDVDAFLASFHEAHLLMFLNSWANGGFQLQ